MKPKSHTKAVAENTNKGRTSSQPSSSHNNFDARDGLGIYIKYPERNPEGRVVEYDDDFVVIRDKFPKARYATSHS